MPIELISLNIRENYEVHEWKHAVAILSQDFPEEWTDILAVLNSFRLKKSWITDLDGQESKAEAAAGVLSLCSA